MVVKYVVNKPPYRAGQERNVPDFMARDLIEARVAVLVDKTKADRLQNKSMHQQFIRNK